MTYVADHDAPDGLILRNRAQLERPHRLHNYSIRETRGDERVSARPGGFGQRLYGEQAAFAAPTSPPVCHLLICGVPGHCLLDNAREVENAPLVRDPVVTQLEKKHDRHLQPLSRRRET